MKVVATEITAMAALDKGELAALHAREQTLGHGGVPVKVVDIGGDITKRLARKPQVLLELLWTWQSHSAKGSNSIS